MGIRVLGLEHTIVAVILPCSPPRIIISQKNHIKRLILIVIYSPKWNQEQKWMNQSLIVIDETEDLIIKTQLQANIKQNQQLLHFSTSSNPVSLLQL